MYKIGQLVVLKKGLYFQENIEAKIHRVLYYEDEPFYDIMLLDGKYKGQILLFIGERFLQTKLDEFFEFIENGELN